MKPWASSRLECNVNKKRPIWLLRPVKNKYSRIYFRSGWNSWIADDDSDNRYGALSRAAAISDRSTTGDPFNDLSTFFDLESVFVGNEASTVSDLRPTPFPPWAASLQLQGNVYKYFASKNIFFHLKEHFFD